MRHFKWTVSLALLCVCVAPMALAQTELHCAVSGIPTPNAGNIDAGGLVTLSATGTGSYLFSHPSPTPPLCNCTDRTNKEPVLGNVSTCAVKRTQAGLQ
jgi:hypothetical protein